ncbi:NAD-dependent epimerase/dehydratase family protein [[Pseudomonas] boreopolis]|uniref:NAD-dependent epimerase/dehydratase family protein n=1 Tax=Xanthomonas boreopolis TaxID=86183 RepID=UPI003DA1727A
MQSRKTVFLTGATGNMGAATLHELMSRGHFRVRALVLPSEAGHPVLRRYAGNPHFETVVGDLRNLEDVARGVAGADQVLHIGGMVSPAADRVPELTMEVNVGGAHNVVEAIQAQPNRDDIRLVYIGTVAQTGHRGVPIHWGRTGDPIKISRFDQYAVSKTRAEAIVAESGLRHWVSLRQTGIAHPGMLKIFDPIMFHATLNAVLEWVTVEDSGRLAANLCEDTVPQALWRGFYNIGGGAPMRVVNHELAASMYAVTGIDDFRRVMEPNWFATRNFHGQWYSDSDALQALVPFRQDTMADFLARLRAAVPWWQRLGARLAKGQVRKRIQGLASGPGGPLYWLEHDDREHIDAYFGSREQWAAIPGWDRFDLVQPSHTPTRLEHGYDETRAPQHWRLDELRQAADFRGGACLSEAMPADAFAPARWRCSQGHVFEMSPNLYLRGGHWCPQCMLDPDSYDVVARRNPFFAQVALEAGRR